ncbi:cytosolic phospholipase a2 epsilon-like [Limosa lapponica baueri]|uniref:Cytosolic phospholipase a2 epsilon-like n=1 Tax=Limosa lapponica baueri TaxID=1758121 RepID=A0A2I0TXV3_LIMLA|nr:cytosolic phospholipase a2 epsilon-like [Limosa lapponica baueri]
MEQKKLNILEITVSDDDIIHDDDHAIVLFDVAKIPLGERVFTAFPLNPQRREELEVEFVLESIRGPPEAIITNGAIVCREVACLEVQLDSRMKKKHFSDHVTNCMYFGIEQVPVVAIMTTGGGTRALTAMYAHLLSVQELNVLDCVSYITGLSGTTCYCPSSKQEDSHKLTDQQQALNQGQNPLPIYLSLNVKDKISDQDFREWVEFTPYEVGFPKYGAFIRAEDFGSEFFMGRLMKKIPESRICFLEGIWSSVFSLNLMDAWYISVHSEDFWHKWTRDKITDIDDETLFPKRPNELDTRVVRPTDSFSDIFRDIAMLRPAASEICNFLKGLQMNNNYLESEFSKWKDCELDSQPNHLTAATDYLILIDTAFAFATSYPPLMRPERKVDVILHFNYSSGSQTGPLKEASKYFEKQGIPFPTKVPDDQETPHLKECYIVGDKESPETPIVIFFPLVNDTFRDYKAPGVKRSPSEMAEGDVDVANTCGPYYINNLSYSEEDFDKLVNLSYYNVQNNKDLILQALRTATERKKQHKKEQPLQKTPDGDGVCAPDRKGTQHLADHPARGNMK